MKKWITVLLISLFMLHLYGCENKPITCEDGYNTVNGQCEWIRTDFESKIDDTVTLTNYTLNISVLLDEEESEITIKFDEDKSYVSYGHIQEYFLASEGKTYQYTQTLDGYTRQEVTSNDLDKYHFYAGLFEKDFIQMNDRYLLNYGTYEAIDAFAKAYHENATFENFSLVVGTKYIEEIKMDIKKGNQTFKLTMVFSDFNQTEVEVPTL